jgi:hypothetical protein
LNILGSEKIDLSELEREFKEKNRIEKNGEISSTPIYFEEYLTEKDHFKD